LERISIAATDIASIKECVTNDDGKKLPGGKWTILTA
jgi:hypothetical protein